MLVKDTVLLRVGRGGEKENFGSDVFGEHFAAPMLGRVFPELRGLDHGQIPNHAPLEIAQPGSLQARVGRADGGILAHDEVPLHDPIDHVHDRCHMGMIAAEMRQVAIGPVLVFRSGIAPPGLQQ